MPHLLIAGCGYIGSALAARAPRLLGETWHLWGLRRQVHELPPGVKPIEADLLDPTLAQRLAGLRFDAVLLCAAPSAGGDAPAYERLYVRGTRNLLGALQASAQRLTRLVFTSSTSVYPQNAGEWVDENAPTQAAGFRATCMLEAEAAVRGSGYPSCIVRLAGIYGPGRAALLKRLRQGGAEPGVGLHYTNRVHRDDCAGLLAHVLRLPQPAPLYLGVDHEPAARSVVQRFLLQRLGRPVAPSDEHAPVTGKRCRNDRLLQSGYRFVYPTYREGLTALLGEAVSAEAPAR